MDKSQALTVLNGALPHGARFTLAHHTLTHSRDAADGTRCRDGYDEQATWSVFVTYLWRSATYAETTSGSDLDSVVDEALLRLEDWRRRDGAAAKPPKLDAPSIIPPPHRASEAG